jgi:hypothetical protein
MNYLTVFVYLVLAAAAAFAIPALTIATTENKVIAVDNN